MALVTIPAGANLVADYASPSVNTKDLRARGFRAVVRYINGDLAKGRKHWKILTIPERDRIWADGLALWLVFEKSATRFLGGYQAGRQDGAEAQADAYLLAYQGVILVAFDADVVAANLATAREYWRGFDEACAAYPIGKYGDWDIINADLGTSALNWQTNAGFWSSVWDSKAKRFRYRGIHPAAHVKQKTGYNIPSGGIDPNDVLKPVTAQLGLTPEYNPPSSYGGWPAAAKSTFHPTEQAPEIRYAQDVIWFEAGGQVPRNGIFDMQTAKRVQDLQRVFGCTDEMPNIGPKTWAAIDYLAVR